MLVSKAICNEFPHEFFNALKPKRSELKPAIIVGKVVSLLKFWASEVEFVNNFKLTEFRLQFSWQFDDNLLVILMEIWIGVLIGILMGILMMVSMGWPYDSSDCLLLKHSEAKYSLSKI